MTAQCLDFRCSLSLAHSEIGHQAFFSCVLSHQQCYLVYRRVRGQNGLDFTQFNTESTNFHLVIVTAQVFDIAVWQITAQVTGAVHPCRWLLAERVLEEAFGSQVVTVQVAPRHTGAADVDLAHNTQEDGLLLLVQQVKLRIANRFADMRSETVFAIHRYPA
ncbi:hypothetical protein ALP49_200011 [Pseudomonas syringae pv. solidagae]|nr:hypothetical protein ALP49_200011 [Pseudomonas syringae pv. solidagae]